MMKSSAVILLATLTYGQNLDGSLTTTPTGTDLNGNVQSTCPADSTFSCQSNQFFEKNTCKCFYREFCGDTCPTGQKLTPIEFCKCVTDQEIIDLFPATMTQAMIDAAMDY